MTTDPRPPVIRDRPIAALLVICLSVFVISVDATIVNVALPTLSRQLDADTAQLQWIVDAYPLVMAGLMLSMGSLSDRFGRRGWLSAGLAVFALTSAIAAQVDSANALIAARAAMGVGAAVIFPTTLSLITNIFADPVARAKAIGLWAAMVGVGVAAGPITGGWLLQHFSWGSIFLVNVSVAAVAIVGRLLFVPTSRDPATPPVDVPRLILSSIGLAVRRARDDAVHPDRPADAAPRWRSRAHDCTGHRGDHGFAQRREGRGWLGRQRHHPRTGRHPRGGDRWQRLRIGVLESARLR